MPKTKTKKKFVQSAQGKFELTKHLLLGIGDNQYFTPRHEVARALRRTFGAPRYEDNVFFYYRRDGSARHQTLYTTNHEGSPFTFSLGCQSFDRENTTKLVKWALPEACGKNKILEAVKTAK